ncbi:MAG: extracellular solute-binding protein [Lachnospiraceae bacterium]
MKCWKRLLSVLLAATMIFSLAGCGGKETTDGNSGNPLASSTEGTNGGGSVTQTPGNTKGEKPIELTVYSQRANFSGEQIGWFAQLLLEKFNVKITIIPDSDGVFDTRMEAGFLGDIVVFGSTGNDYQRAVKAGMLLDWEKYNLLDTYGSYIKEHMSKALEANRGLTPDDGAIHGFGYNVSPTSDSFEEFFYTWDVRWDLYKQLGYPVVKDLDDMVTLFEQMKEICPTDDNGNQTYAVSLWPDWDGNMVMYVKAMATAYYGYDELALGVYDSDTGTFHDALEENGPYLTCLKFFNTLYQKGLLDPNSMTQTYDEMADKVKAGGVFFSIFNYSGNLAYNTDKHLAENKIMCTLLPENAVPLTYGMSVYGGSSVWAIGANSQYPDVCMQIINWLSTPEGRMESEYGPKGLTWDYDENGYTYLTELGLKCKADGSTPMEGAYAGATYKDGQQQINNITWSINAPNPDSNGETYNYQTWKSYVADASCEMEQDWRDYTGAATSLEYLKGKTFRVAPATTYKDTEMTDEFEVMWNQVTKCIVNGTWNAIYAKNDKEFEYIVNNMIKSANAYGYAKCKEWSLNEAARRHELEEATR